MIVINSLIKILILIDIKVIVCVILKYYVDVLWYYFELLFLIFIIVVGYGGEKWD